MNERLTDDLRAHLNLCEEILRLAQDESQALRDPSQPSPFTAHQARKNLLPRLEASLESIRRCRLVWQKMSSTERAEHPEVPSLLRQNQDLIMKILVLDRENEQGLLRRGLVPPPPPAPGRSATTAFCC